LRHVLLAKASLRGADLTGARLGGSNLPGVDTRPLDITVSGRCLREKQYLNLTSLEQEAAGVEIPTERGSFCTTVLDGANLAGVDLPHVNLAFASLQGAFMRDANLHGATLFRAKMAGVHLGGSDLQGAHLARAEAPGADLSRARLQGANLQGTYLDAARLFSANLEGADLRRARLQGAILDSARLRGADLRGSEIGGASFRWTKLDLADLRSVRTTGLFENTRQEHERLLSEITMNENQRKLTLEQLESITESIDFSDAAGEGVLCSSSVNILTRRFGDAACPSDHSDDYDVNLVESILKPLMCGDADIARMMAVRVISSGKDRYEHQRKYRGLIRELLLSGECSANAQLPDPLRDELESSL
jgi:uncharacterized protein YjbI with pentapeptide repeats